jgi:hypothetical protein
MNIINCTPHIVNVGSQSFAPSGICPRCIVNRVEVGEINGIPVFKSVMGAVENAPEPQHGTIFIVSMVVATTANRPDFVFPDGIVRNEAGVIIGCTGFAVV